jgi:hypothetical protein
MHKFEVGQKVWAKTGRRYTVLSLRSDSHHKLKGEIGYSVRGERDGVPFGPCRLMRESAFRQEA